MKLKISDRVLSLKFCKKLRATMTATPSRGIVVIGGSGTRSVEQIPSHELFWSEGSVLENL